MRISHIQLETCRSNPIQWVKLRLNQGTSTGPQFSMSYDRALRLAIHSFHKTDATTARRYLENLILRQQQKKKFLNRPRVDGIRRDLESYMRWRKSCSDTVIDSDFQLKDTGTSFLTLGGKISRLDLTSNGYRAVLFGVPNPTWKQDVGSGNSGALIPEILARSAPAGKISCRLR